MTSTLLVHSRPKSFFFYVVLVILDIYELDLVSESKTYSANSVAQFINDNESVSFTA